MYEMPLVFKFSKIYLNITLRSIRNGIPLRAMDIMGAGGFLLTNYQNDFAMHFVDGEDYVSYSDREDMLNKIKYYLEHEDERKMIAENGCRKVREEHTYTLRLSEIIGSIYRYDAELVKRGVRAENIHHYGFAFRGKEVLIDGR